MLKIKDLEVGSNTVISLMVREASHRTTRPPKNSPYLDLVLFDGSQEIAGKLWDYPADKPCPRKDVVYDIPGQVTEYQGKKQLTVKGMSINHELTIADFMPDSGYDPETLYFTALDLMHAVHDTTLRELAVHCLEDYKDAWLLIPGAKTIHHAFAAGTLVHCLSVAKISKAIAEVTTGANIDLATVGGMLHDFGKLHTYAFEGISINFTDEGMLFEHPVMGAEMLQSVLTSHFGLISDISITKVNILKHIILSHHRELQYGSPVEPHCIEAMIVAAADSVDASAEAIREAAEKTPDDMWTDKIYSMSNKPAIVPSYINTLFSAVEK
jgi:3'-5' exoribonuclease